jgi:outer membrane protein
MRNSAIVSVAFCAAMLLPAAPVSAQGAATALPMKVGVVDFRTAIASTAEGRQVSAELQSQFSARQAELENISKSMEDIQNRVRTADRTISDDERARLQRQYQRLQQQLQRKQEEFQQDLNDAQEDAFKRMGAKMQDVVQRYSRENGYTMVVDPSQAGVIYFANQLDVTQDLIRLYDQAYPAKASATPAAKPAAGTTTPRPAPSTTAPAKPKP